MCSKIHTADPKMLAQQVQKTASVRSGFRLSILRITNISRQQYVA